MRGGPFICRIAERECGQKVGLDTQRQKEREKMYSEERYHRALEVYEETQ